MEPTSQRTSVNPRALVGKILLINGVVFLALGIVLGGFTLLTQRTQAGATVIGLLALIFAMVGALESLAGLIVWRLPGGVSAPAAVVNHYYTALEQQDYATAFQYLDLSLGPLFGQQITQADFIRRAQTYDAEHGSVVQYALAGVRANPSRREFTIRVTRGAGSYRTRLQLAKVGPEWKIVSFDLF